MQGMRDLRNALVVALISIGLTVGALSISLVEFVPQAAPTPTNFLFPSPAPLTASVDRQVKDWEQFLNGASHKEQLMSRYLYEHLFLGHLHFDDDPLHRPFRIVRSATPPGPPTPAPSSAPTTTPVRLWSTWPPPAPWCGPRSIGPACRS